MTSLQPWLAALASAALLALLIFRGRPPGRLYLDALAIGVALGAAVAVALAPFDLRANPLKFSPLTVAFVFAGLTEEGVKTLGVVAFLRGHYLARRPRDVTLAAGALALGFAALEDLFYLANAGAGWATLAVERALTAVPFHVFLGLAAGAAVARVRAGALGVAAVVAVWLALAFVHGVYDFAVFAGARHAAPDLLRLGAAKVGLDPDSALRALFVAAEAAAAFMAAAAAATLGETAAPAPAGRLARFALSRALGLAIALALIAGAVLIVGAGGVLGFIADDQRAAFAVAILAVAPLGLGALFLLVRAAPARRLSTWARRRWAIAAAGAAALLVAGEWRYGPAQAHALAALRLQARAARLAAGGDYSQALDALDRALAEDFNAVSVRAQRARVFTAQQRYAPALADIDAALRVAPGAVALYEQRADVDRQRDDPAAAVADLDAALKLKPGDARLLASRAQSRMEGGDSAAARADLADAARIAPDDAFVQRVAAALAVDSGDFDAALRELNARLHDDPHDVVAAFARGRVWLYKGDAARALADFTAADRQPGFLYPALWRFLAGAQLRGAPNATELFARLRAAPPQTWPAPLARALAFSAPAPAGSDAGQRCEADFYSAALRVAEGETADAGARLAAIEAECPTDFIEREAAKAMRRRYAP